MADTLEIIEKRVAFLENLVGNFEKLDNTKGLDTLVDVSNRLNNYIGGSAKIAATYKLFNDIQKYKSYDYLNEIEDESMLNSKIELILSEEQHYRRLNEDFQNFRNLVKILDDKTLNDVPKLTEKLKDIGSREAGLREQGDVFRNEIKEFLVLYYASMKSINETMGDLNEYLDQYDPDKSSK